jgi:sugar phosphate isomerase/epimerase
MSRVRVGVQLIVFGERPGTDLTGVLTEVKSAGYDGFEGGVVESSEAQRRLSSDLQSIGLGYVGAHAGIHQLSDTAAVSTFAQHINQLQGRFLMASGRYDSLAGYREGAELLTRAAEECASAGVTVCYHNHFWEFEAIDGEVPIHLLMEMTDPALVKLCPDIYWVHVGGEAPADFLTRYRDRCPCLHFKDGLAGDQMRDFRELGDGVVDVKAALDAALACDPDWIVVEQDSTTREPAESIRMSRDYLRTLGL